MHIAEWSFELEISRPLMLSNKVFIDSHNIKYTAALSILDDILQAWNSTENYYVILTGLDYQNSPLQSK